MLDIVLTFHSTCNDNLGVGALTVANLNILRGVAHGIGIDAKFHIIDAAGLRPPYVSGPDVVLHDLRELRQPMAIYRLFRASDLVVDIGGGDSFSDIYGTKRLLRLLLLKQLAVLAGRPLCLAPQTIGPFSKPIWRRLSLQAISRSAFVATRDSTSTGALRNMGFRGEIVEAADVALKLPHTQPGPNRPRDVTKIGLNISGLLMKGGYTGRNMFGLSLDYPALIHRIIEELLDQPEAIEMHLVPHVISSTQGALEDDYAASMALAEIFPQVKVAPRFASPSEAKSYVAGMDFFMGARMHSCIAAFSTGVPVVPMAYSRKFEGFFGTLGYEYTVDCTTATENDILSAIISSFSRRKEIAQELDAAHQKGLARLKTYERALSKLFENAVRKRQPRVG